MSNLQVDDLSECQIPCLPNISEGKIRFEKQPLRLQLKRSLAKPWNYHIKRFLKKIQKTRAKRLNTNYPNQLITASQKANARLVADDWVRVRSREEIQATLDTWNELRGCAFLENMWQYCGTTQQVLISMKRFLDERDYKVKKTNGVILLKEVLCEGTPVFGRCDRRCHYFWREEWLEKILPPDNPAELN